MDAIAEQGTEGDCRPNAPDFREVARPILDRLRAEQLRDGSSYSRLRGLLPVLVLAVVWILLIHNSVRSTSALLGLSINIRHLLIAFGVLSVWSLWLNFSIYSSRSAKCDLLAEVFRIAAASFACGLIPLIANVGRGTLERGVFVSSLTAAGLLVFGYGLLGSFLIGAIICPWLGRPRAALIVGTGRRASTLRSRLQDHYSSFQIIGCVDDEYFGKDRNADRYLGPINILEGLLKTHPIEVVLIGLPLRSMYADIQRVIEICESVGVEAQYMRDIFQTSRVSVEASPREPHHFAVLRALRRDPRVYLKRMLDLILGSAILIAVAPIMIAAAVAVRLTSPGPILFVQDRYGRYRKQFPMFKFRSMVVDAEKQQASLETLNEAEGPVFKMKIDPRVTRVGKFLRRTSIDELPQLFNVLRGEMSLVGPRPLPLRDVSRFEESWLLRRFSVRPGLTCLWQINGRDNTCFDSWVKQDLTYIDQWSLTLDFNILIRTLPAVLRGSGAV
jgi:exopolysaccharide biosynthesis polyprenyl glycosylphosphotransferase